MNRNRNMLLVILGVVGIILVGALAWYLVSPLFIQQTVDEAFPLEIPDAAEMAAMSEAEIEEMRVELEATAAVMPDTTMAEEMPAGDPILVQEGIFMDADAFHQGEGSATIYELPDGTFVLRLEDFMVTNGPDLHVLLATGEAPTGRDDLGEYVDLGSLKGNVGSQNYPIPAGLDVSQFQSVVIYCMPFHVVFSTATLSG